MIIHYSLLDAHYTNDAPGCAILISKGDTILYESARGISDVGTKEKIDVNTSFNIASISKQFTAVAVLKLHEEGKLSIEDSVAKFFPEFKSDIWEMVKLKHLMSHCSGVPDKRPRIDRDFMLHIVDAQCLEYMVDLNELKFEPDFFKCSILFSSGFQKDSIFPFCSGFPGNVVIKATSFFFKKETVSFENSLSHYLKNSILVYKM